eukprot:jgi/Hompol1/3804/HPOL_003357-RA
MVRLKNIRTLKTTLPVLQNPKPELAHAAIVSLQFVFAKLIANGSLDRKKKEPNADASADTDSTSAKQSVSSTVSEWLRENRLLYLAQLRQTIIDSNTKLQMTALEKYVMHIKDASDHVNEFQLTLFIPLIETIICIDNLSPAVIAKLVDNLNSYDDLRFAFFKAVSKLVLDRSEKHAKKGAGSRNPISLTSTFEILRKLAPAPASVDDLAFFCNCNVHGLTDANTSATTRLGVYKKAFSSCWLAYMRHPLSKQTYRAILESLHQQIIPHLTQPVLLMDFLVDAYNTGGIVSLLALNGLFTLINEHNLDYPDFYKKLYQLLDLNLLHYKYRSRFFRLADLFLSSAYLPAYLVASFVKRMARLCLFAPPGGIIMILPIIFNILKKHPSSIRLIHTRDSVIEQIEDTYNFDEKDPAKCGAETSYLWEIVALKQHALQAVSGLARVFEDSLAKPPYDIEDFMDHTFKTVTAARMKLQKCIFDWLNCDAQQH